MQDALHPQVTFSYFCKLEGDGTTVYEFLFLELRRVACIYFNISSVMIREGVSSLWVLFQCMVFMFCQDCVCLNVLVCVVYAFIVFSNVVKCCLDSIGCVP